MAMPPLPDEWKEEFARLRAEREQSQRELTALRRNLDQLTRMMAKQSDQLDQVVSMLRRREAQLKRVEGENRRLRRRLGLDDPDPEPTAEPVPINDSEAESDEASTRSGSGSKASSEAETRPPAEPPARKPRPRSYGGRRPPPAHLPTDTERHEVCACQHCGGRVCKRDVLTTRVYTVVPSYVRCRSIERERVVCADPTCNRPTTAPTPPMPCQRALYDCHFIAWLVVMKFVLLVPLDRLRTLLLSQGVVIAMGTLVSLIERAAKLADAIDGEHFKQLRSGTWMSFDGTGLKTLVVGQDKAWDGYLEVYTRDELTVFQFDMTKHADQLERRIGEYLGVLVCDAESRNAAGATSATLSYCNAHPLRKFRDAERVHPKLAAQGQRFIQALYDLEDEADELGLFGAERLAFRQRRSRRVLHRFRQWLEGVVARPLPPSDPVRRVASYYLKHFEALSKFVSDASLPLDNNAAEREFQRHAKLRYASLFAGSPEGGHRWATLLGVVRTAQKCDVDVLAYLVWMFERRGSHRTQFAMSAAELTPMAYKRLGAPGAIRPAA
ncbi:MAG TPA: IS66 family transposase [Polyangiaceae bacterium]|nr:IS66 family transposase [Polyangiaceae bacterium]